MKRLFVSLLLLIAATAQATDCGPKAGKNLRLGMNINPSSPGLWWSYWCMESGKYKLYISAIRALDAASVASDYATVLNAENYGAAIAAFAARNPALPQDPNDARVLPIWQPAQSLIYSSEPPIPMKWVVAPNGSYATRQWWAINPTTLVLGAKTSGAPVGVQCWPDVGGKMQIEDGNEVFYLPFGTTMEKARNDRVTICVKVPA
jgi:hypothetical protein